MMDDPLATRRVCGAMIILLIITIISSTAMGNVGGRVRFAMHCNRLVSARADPDSFPGECSSHVHDAFGAATWNPEVKKTHLRRRFKNDDGDFNLTESTCAHPKDRSMYWNPSLYLRARPCTSGEKLGDNGCGMLHLATPTKMTVYYKDPSLGRGIDIIRNRDRLRIFPKNFRIRVDPAKRPQERPHWWACAGTAPSGKRVALSLFKFPGRSSWRTFLGMKESQHCETLMLRIPFPPCFKSVKDPPNSGVKPNNIGLCPQGYPIRFPELQYNMEWNLTHIFRGKNYCGSWEDCIRRLASGDQDYTGEMFHAVFINGWSKPLLEKSMKLCTFRPGAASGSKCPLEKVLGGDAIRKAPKEGNAGWLGKDRQHQLPHRLPIEDVATFRFLPNINRTCNIPHWS